MTRLLGLIGNLQHVALRIGSHDLAEASLPVYSVILKTNGGSWSDIILPTYMLENFLMKRKQGSSQQRNCLDIPSRYLKEIKQTNQKKKSL